jgi:hypothetical protein
MKINWGKVASFLAGGCVGAAISAFVTDKMVSKAYSRAADDEIHEINSVANERIKKARKEVTELKQKVAQQKVTINTLADQVRESGKDVSDILKDDDDSEDDPGQVNERKPVERREKAEKSSYRSYARRYRRAEDRDDEEDVEFTEEEAEDEEEAIRHNSPRVIDADTAKNTPDGYSRTDLYYYMYDGKVLSEDNEYLDNYAGLIGEDWLSGDHEDGDEVYVRNDELCADYCIEFRGGYGESHISQTDIWED